MTIDEIKAQLKAPRDASAITRDDVPPQQGLYVWFGKPSEEVLYVGKASGKGGLRKRIWSQHLNPKYLENRVAKFQAADEFQLSCRVLRGGKPCVEQSVFRRSIARAFN